MAWKDTATVSAAPVALRLALGFIMLWSGVGKLFTTVRYTPAEAAILADLKAVDSRRFEPSLPVRLERVSQDGPAPVPLTGRLSRAGDLPRGVESLKLYKIALLVHDGADADGRPRIVPARCGQRPWPVAVAWGASFVQALGGVAVLVGLFTRFFAGLTTLFLLGALWLTQFGPAIRGGDALLGFLPSHARFDEAAWMPLGILVCLLAMSGALTCAGSGGLSLDRAVGGTTKPAKPKEG